MRTLPALALLCLILSAAAAGAQEGTTASTDPGLPSAEAGEDAPEGIAPAVESPAAIPSSAAPAQGLRLRGSASPVAPLTSVARPRERVLAVPPITGGPGSASDRELEDRSAFNPVGLKIGSFVLNSTSRTAVGATTNASGSSSGDAAAYVDGEGEVVLKSDWEVHSLDLAIRGGVRDYLFTDKSAEPDADVRLNGRIDLSEVDSVGLGAAYAWSREDSDDVESSGSGANIHTFSFSSGYQRRAGLLGLDLKGAVDRTVYDKGDDRDETLLTGAIRLSLDSGAVLQPFAEVGALTRLRDRTRDEAGYERSSVGGEVKAGLSVDTGLVAGELAAGYALEHFDDARLADLKGMLVEGSLAWAPTPLTTVTVTADTRFEPTRLAGASGSITRSLDVLAEYALRPNILVGAGATLAYQSYTGNDRTVTTASVRGGVAWKLNPTVELGLTATHTMEDVSVAGEDNRETTVEASVTVRR